MSNYDNNGNALYGGGGSSGANYFDTSVDFSGPSGNQNQGGYNSREEGYPSGNQERYGGYPSGGSQGGGYQQQQQQDPDFSSAMTNAQSQHPSTSPDLFSSALSFLKDHKDQFLSSSSSNVDQSQMISAHQAMYGGGGDDQQQHDSRAVGMGAAMQALKMFTSSQGGGSGAGAGAGGAGGADMNSLIGMAMAQAGKLFDEKQSAGSVTGDKQSAINTAAEAAMKMYLHSQGGGMQGTGGPGGASGLLSLASKFF